MFHLIIKNLWSRRRRNGWLLAELIVVSVICWVVLDPVVVRLHDLCLPAGYDNDRLCLVSLGGLEPGAADYDPQAADSAAMADAFFRLVRRAQDFEGVERTAPLTGFCYPGSQGNGNTGLQAVGDSTAHQVGWVGFLPRTGFFETFGFRPAGDVTIAELSSRPFTAYERVVTRNASRMAFGTDLAKGKLCVYNEDTLTVVGTLESCKYLSSQRPYPLIFIPQEIDPNDIPQYAKVLVRLKEGVSTRKFIEKFRPWMVKEMRSGNLYANNVQSYAEIERKLQSRVTLLFRTNLCMAVFFLVNLGLGVLGTFWLQTRTRREEVGIMLSFGATPGRVVRLLLGEGAVLTVTAALVGFFLYLQYAWSEGLDNGVNWDSMMSDTYWVSDFGQHFIVVCGLILIILLAVVSAGIYIPAHNISRIHPVDALRDE